MATDTGTEGRQCEDAQEERSVKTGLEQCTYKTRASQVALVVKNPAAIAGDLRDKGSIPGSGISPGGRNGHSL